MGLPLIQVNKNKLFFSCKLKSMQVTKHPYRILHRYDTLSNLTLLFQALLFVWEQHEQHEHRTYHAHRSISGVALALVRILLAAIFALNLYTTVSRERSTLKRNFYVSFTKVSPWLIWSLNLFKCQPQSLRRDPYMQCHLRVNSDKVQNLGQGQNSDHLCTPLIWT